MIFTVGIVLRIVYCIIFTILLSIYFPISKGLMTFISMSLLIIVLLTMNNRTKSIVLILFVGPVIGMLFYILHIPLVGYLCCAVLGLFYMRKEVFKIFTEHNYSFFYFFILLIIYACYYLLGPQHGYSEEKLLSFLIKGAPSLFAFILYIESDDMEELKIAQLLCTISLLYISLAFDYCYYTRPSSFGDFDFLRSSSVIMMHKEEAINISYHSIGISSMLGVAFILSNRNIRLILKNERLILFLILLFIVFISQARQAIIGVIVIIAVRLLIDINIKKRTKFSLLILLLASFTAILSFSGTKAFKSSLNAKSTSQMINRDYSDAKKILERKLFFGAGLGGYSTNGKRAYPHNLFLELLCEIGIVGTLVTVLLITMHLREQKFTFLYATNSGLLYLPLITAIFIRAMISADLIENIILITALLSVTKNTLIHYESKEQIYYE